MKRTTWAGIAACVCSAAFCGTGRAQFVAYNDFIRGAGTSSNASSYHFTITNSGPLLNITNGARTAVTLTITNVGVSFGGVSVVPSNGSPAALVFGRFVHFGNGIPLVSDNDILAHVLTGLDPARRYSIHGTAGRGIASYTGRWSCFELAQAQAFANAHSAGCYTNGSGGLTLASNQVALWTGDNRAGEVAGWTNVAPSPEGVLVVYSRRLLATPVGYTFDASAYGYGLEALRVEESFAPAPAVTAEPADVAAALGDPFSLTVTARGAEPLAYQWRRGPSSNDLTLLPGATNAVWLVASASAQDMGYYDVVVSNPHGSATSRVVSVRITTEPPVILAQPADLTVFLQTPAAFSVSVSGANPASFQWYKDGVALAGATGTSYSIPSAGLEHAGVYGFAASNRLGAVASSNAVLSVVDAPPAVTLQPLDQTSTEGGSVTLLAAATGTRLNWQWFLGDELLEGQTNASLALTNLLASQSGYYQLHVWNTANSVWSRSALVAVALAPVLFFGTNQVWAYNDTGADLGTNWFGLSYPPAENWPRGPGLLGFKVDGSGNSLALDTAAVPGFQYFRTGLSRTGTDGSTNATFYLRTTFLVDTNAFRHGGILVFSNLIDDGAILYLNGSEVFRYGMPSGSGQGLWAGASTNASAWVRVALAPSLLRPGTNVAAVELHQINAASTDLDYLGMLCLETPPPAPLAALRYPAGTNVLEGTPVSLSVELTNAATVWADYQWYKVVDGQPQALPQATGPALHIPRPVSGVDDGAYFVTVSNPVTYLVSPLARLEVIADTTPAALSSAEAAGSNSVALLYTKAVAAQSATNPACYVVRTTFGQTVPVLSVVQTGFNSVLLTTGPCAAGFNWIVEASGIADASPRANVSGRLAAPVATVLQLGAMDDTWAFANPVAGIDDAFVGVYWRMPGIALDPAAWARGRAPFGCSGQLASPGAWPVRTPLSYGTPLACFRITFESLASPLGAVFMPGLLNASGTQVYLNGNLLPDQPQDAAGLVSGTNTMAVRMVPSAGNPAFLFAAAPSARILSLVLGPVEILSGPQDQTVMENQPVSFAIQSVGGAQMQWYQDGVPIPGATGQTLTLPKASMSLNGARFHAEVWNPWGRASSAVATLGLAPAR